MAREADLVPSAGATFAIMFRSAPHARRIGDLEVGAGLA